MNAAGLGIQVLLFVRALAAEVPPEVAAGHLVQLLADLGARPLSPEAARRVAGHALAIVAELRGVPGAV